MYVPCLVYIYRWFVGVPGICVHAAGAVFLSRDRSVSALALSDDGEFGKLAPEIGRPSVLSSPGFQALLQSVAMIAGTITTGRGYSHPDFGCNRRIIL
jgi:hypothetical protein